MHMLFRFDGYELRPIASYGYGHGVPLKEPGSVGLAKDPREILPPEFAKFCFFDQSFKNQVMEMKRPMHRWIDRNGDGLLQGEELTVWTPGWEPGSPRFAAQFVDAGFTLWARGYKCIFRVPVQSWTQDGIPIYPDATAVKPLFMTSDHNLYDVMPDEDSQRIYAFYHPSGDLTRRGDYCSMVCYDYQGNVLWEYSLVWPCFALDSPFWKPGYLIGANVFVGSVKLASGVKLLMTNGYYGDYHCITTDGLWVDHFASSLYAKAWTTGVFSPVTATHSADVHPDNLVPFEPGGFGIRQGTKVLGTGANARELKVATAYATNRDDKGLWRCPIDVNSWKAAGRDQWKKIPTVGAALADPGEIAMLEDGVMAVADAGGVVFLREAEGKLESIARLDKWGDAPDQSFGKEIHIAADGPHLVIADTQRHRVLWFHAESRQFKAQFGDTDTPGVSLGALDRPKCLGIRGNRLAVYDASNQRIVKAVLME
jgi:hypothetical protein